MMEIYKIVIKNAKTGKIVKTYFYDYNHTFYKWYKHHKANLNKSNILLAYKLGGGESWGKVQEWEFKYLNKYYSNGKRKSRPLFD